MSAIQAMPLQPGSQGGGPGPLSADHLRALGEARVRSRKVRRAAGVATMSGWTMAFFALMTLLPALFGDFVSLVLGIGLSVVAFNELRGAAMLKRLDANGAKRLGWNQIGLGALIVLYSLWSLVSALRDPLALVGGSTGNAEANQMLTGIAAPLAAAIYGTMAIIGVIGPGLTAWYYFTRGRLVREVVAQTPAWVIDAMRATA
jgi:hypothetical protein